MKHDLRLESAIVTIAPPHSAPPSLTAPHTICPTNQRVHATNSGTYYIQYQGTVRETQTLASQVSELRKHVYKLALSVTPVAPSSFSVPLRQGERGKRPFTAGMQVSSSTAAGHLLRAACGGGGGGGAKSGVADGDVSLPGTLDRLHVHRMPQAALMQDRHAEGVSVASTSLSPSIIIGAVTVPTIMHPLAPAMHHPPNPSRAVETVSRWGNNVDGARGML
jgi:hypothetical protein